MAKITVELTDDEHERFVQAKMRRKERSLQSLMIGATERLLDARAAAPAPAPDNLVPFPDLLAGLDADDAWLVHHLAAILRDRPQGGIYQALATTLHQAVTDYVARTGNQRPTHSGDAKPERHKVKSLTAKATEADIPWLERLLQILHSRKPGLPTAVQNNLHEFAWADEAWSELEKRNSPLVSPAAAGARERGAAPPKLATLAETPGDPPGPGSRATRAGQKLDAVEEANASGGNREKRPARKAR